MLVFLVFNVIGIGVSAQSVETCSPLCVCDVWYKLQRASCTGRHLYSVHAGTMHNVEALDLSDNVVSTLNGFELENVGLANVKFLNLSKNTISDIDLNAFYGLFNLTILDLSRNHLYSISSDVFVENKNLKILYLSKNNFNSHVPKLRTTSLTELNLDSCQISHLPSDTFSGLPRLQRLNLSNNLMIQLSRSVLQKLPHLKEISLEENPWSCNKDMHQLYRHLVHHGVKFLEFCGLKHPKKFEKMVVAPTKDLTNYSRSAATNATTAGTVISKDNLTSVSDNKTQLICEESKKQMLLSNSLWLLVIGFILGTACGLIGSYIWLSGMCSCVRSRRQGNTSSDVWGHTILLNPYLLNSVDNHSLTESCPGTPPPSYREVMLRPSRYRLMRH
nr:leucine-rich repeat transmembrane protein FLRT1-like [Megalopta genalis]XP_033322064.1 leucine-rich repeat transmembrane protein FLRT1-like [Megalopta genalis]